jgi:hypothetical protein
MKGLGMTPCRMIAGLVVGLNLFTSTWFWYSNTVLTSIQFSVMGLSWAFAAVVVALALIEV